MPSTVTRGAGGNSGSAEWPPSRTSGSPDANEDRKTGIELSADSAIGVGGLTVMIFFNFVVTRSM